MNVAKTYIPLLLCILLLISCNSETVTLKGKVIEFDFNYVESIEPGTKINIDQWEFEHVKSFGQGLAIDFPLPIEYVETDTVGERIFSTPVPPTHIGSHLGRNLREINLNWLPDSSPMYEFRNPGLLVAAGKLHVAKTDSSELKVVVPKDYQVLVKVIE